jgi:integrase
VKSKDGLTPAGKTKDGKKRWHARITARDGGKKVVDTERYIVADTIGKAQTERERITKQLLEKKTGRAKNVERIKLNDALDGFLADITRHGTKKTWTGYARRIRATFPNLWLDELGPELMQRHLTKLGKEGLVPSTVGGYRSVYVGVFEWAIDHGHARRPNPADELVVKAKKSASAKLAEIEKGPPKKSLRPDEIPGFLLAMWTQNRFVAVMETARLSVGMRFAEGSAMKRADVDWETGEFDVKRGQVEGRIGPPKADKARLAAYPASILEMLKKHVAEMDELKWPGHEEWLFPSRPLGRRGKLPIWSYPAVHRVLTIAKTKSGVYTANATHLIRHTTSTLMKGRIEDSVMRGVMGWASTAMQDNYGTTPALQFAERMGESLAKVLGPGAVENGVDSGDANQRNPV